MWISRRYDNTLKKKVIWYCPKNGKKEKEKENDEYGKSFLPFDYLCQGARFVSCVTFTSKGSFYPN